MQSSIALYSALAAGYDALFEVPHRRAYDDLALEYVLPLLPATPGIVVDAGCANGRWSHRLIEIGHEVIGIEQSPAMAAAARARLGAKRFMLIEGSMEDADLPLEQADLVLALGSLQYTRDPEKTIERFAGWVRPGGWVVVLVDSLVALVLELMAAGKYDEALLRLETRMGTWVQGEQSADYHLLDRERLESAFRNAGLGQVCTRGLLVGAAALGKAKLTGQLLTAREQQMALERKLASAPVLADAGKQLLVYGRKRASR